MRKYPTSVRLEPSPVVIASAPEESTDGPREFEMVAYTGAKVYLGNFGDIVFDLAGISVPTQVNPILRQHDPDRLVGMSRTVAIADKMDVGGALLSGDPFPAAAEVLQSSDQGFPWQSSVGLDIVDGTLEWIGEGITVNVNGRDFEGPLLLARKTILREISFVPMGADDQTSAAVLSFVEREELSTPQEDLRVNAQEMQAAFPNDPKFALEAVVKGWSVDEAKNKSNAAKAAKVDELREVVATLNGEVTQLKADLAAAKAAKPAPIGALPAAQSEGTGTGDGTFTSQWNKLKAEMKSDGVATPDIPKKIKNGHPEVWVGYLAESAALVAAS